MGLTLEGSPSSSNGDNPHALSQVTIKELVHAFYHSDDISWQALGCKDSIIIQETDEHGAKTKQTEQVQYMLMFLKEASKFKEINTNTKIGLGKFCNLRPQRVKLFPHQVCVCSCHENIRLLLTALKRHTQLSLDFHSFVDQVTCNSSEKKCIKSEWARIKLINMPRGHSKVLPMAE